MTQQHDRLVLIGLGWLYGRGEFPPQLPLLNTCCKVSEQHNARLAAEDGSYLLVFSVS